MQELKKGSTAVYEINGETLRLTPIVWGRMKIVLRLISDSWASFDKSYLDDPAKMMNWMMTMLEARMDDLFPLIVDEKQNPFFNKQWVDDNLTLEHIQKIIMDAIIINGVKDFLAQAGKGQNLSQQQETKKEEAIPA